MPHGWHRHTPLTPVSLQFFLVLTAAIPVRELSGRPRPRLGDDLVWFLRPPVPSPESGTEVRPATHLPTPGSAEVTGFPLRLRVLSRTAADVVELHEVDRLPKKFSTSRHRRDTHVLVDLAVRRPTPGACSVLPGEVRGSARVADVRRER